MKRVDRTVGATRISPVYTEHVAVPRELRPFLWDCPDGHAPLEKVVLRALTYGSFNHLRFVCQKFPAAARRVAKTYPDLRRGVRYWVPRLAKRSRAA